MNRVAYAGHDVFPHTLSGHGFSHGHTIDLRTGSPFFGPDSALQRGKRAIGDAHRRLVQVRINATESTGEELSVNRPRTSKRHRHVVHHASVAAPAMPQTESAPVQTVAQRRTVHEQELPHHIAVKRHAKPVAVHQKSMTLGKMRNHKKVSVAAHEGYPQVQPSLSQLDRLDNLRFKKNLPTQFTEKSKSPVTAPDDTEGVPVRIVKKTKIMAAHQSAASSSLHVKKPGSIMINSIAAQPVPRKSLAEKLKSMPAPVMHPTKPAAAAQPAYRAAAHKIGVKVDSVQSPVTTKPFTKKSFIAHPAALRSAIASKPAAVRAVRPAANQQASRPHADRAMHIAKPVQAISQQEAAIREHIETRLKVLEGAHITDVRPSLKHAMTATSASSQTVGSKPVRQSAAAVARRTQATAPIVRQGQGVQAQRGRPEAMVASNTSAVNVEGTDRPAERFEELDMSDTYDVADRSSIKQSHPIFVISFAVLGFVAIIGVSGIILVQFMK